MTALAFATPPVVAIDVIPPVGETTTATGLGVATVGLGIKVIAPEFASV